MRELLANPWYANLPAPLRAAMLEQSETLRLRPGEMLFRQGAGASGLYALVKGALKMSSLREDGREAILAVVEPGIWFGEISLIDGLPRTHDATALGDVTVLHMPRAVFDRLMHDPVFARAVAALLAARVRLLYGIVEDTALRSMRARVARRLLLLASGEVAIASQRRMRVPVSQEGLAMMLGITRQTLSKELRVLVREGAIELGYGYIDIASEAALRQIGAAR